MPSPEDFVLRVTAGTSYDEDSHVEVPVNKAEPLHLDGPGATIALNVRIHDYIRGPRGLPATSPYFAAEPHATNGDTYSITMLFTPKKPGRNDDNKEDEEEEEADEGISGHDLQFGNDFDYPIRDHLPPGFNTALRIVKWWVDPGMDGDPYADRPYMYGPALSSFNTVHVAEKKKKKKKEEEKESDTSPLLLLHHPERGLWIEEGGDEAGLARRAAAGLPYDETLDSRGNAAARRKWALQDAAKTQWKWEYDAAYGLDFFNGYLDFASLALRLPGFQLPVMQYWDGQSLRYVLRHRTTGQVYLVVVFSLLRKEDEDKEKDGDDDGKDKKADLKGPKEQETIVDTTLEQVD